MARRLEATHCSFALTCRLMRVLAAIVQPPMAAMLDVRHHLLFGCFVAAKLIRGHYTRDVLTSLEQLAEKLLDCGFVPSALHEDIKDVPVLVYCTPQIGCFAVDSQKHLVGRRDIFRYPTPHWNRACDVNRTRLGRGDTFQSARRACLAAGRLRSCTLVHA